MNLKKIPGMAVGSSLGLGMAAASADNKEDAFMRGVMFGLGGAMIGARTPWMQEAGMDLGKGILGAIKPKAVTKAQEFPKETISKVKIPEATKKDLAENIGKTIKQPGITVGKATKFLGASIAKALGTLGAKKGVLALGLL